MDAVLTPSRSLSARGLAWLLGAVAAINAVFAVILLAQGAWPVIGFLALDVALLWGAFRLNNRAAARVERVLVAPDRILVSRLSPRRAAAHYVAHPAWARVEPAYLDAVRIAAGGRVVSVGAFLSPPERAAFARALEAAIARARARAPT